jgi:two-component system response regulator NreC
MDKIRIMLADDHVVLRTGLAMLLNAQPDMSVVGEATSGLEAIEMAQSLEPDVILMDMTMPGVGGIEATEKMCSRNLSVKIIFLTQHEDEVSFREAFRAGASGYVLKRVIDNDLLSAIRAVSQGGVYVHPTMTQYLVGKLVPEASHLERSEIDIYDQLSGMSKKILQLTAHGYTNKQIAEDLSLSLKTVESYKVRIMRKMGFRSRAELVRFAVKQGLLNAQFTSSYPREDLRIASGSNKHGSA